MATSARLSVIVPVLNEAKVIRAALAPLASLRSGGHEVIVVDGGSADDTLERALPLADRVVSAPRGRARQMNVAAEVASGDVLVFLHADTLLPCNAAQLIIDGLQRSGRKWGRFDVRIDGGGPLLRLVAAMMNLRSRLTGIATGDQCMFVTVQAFRAVGGFPAIPLMEDVALSSLLARRSRPVCLRAKAATSRRRWERHGIARTILLMWWLRFRYFVGVAPERLAREYEDAR
jgi:rSAM/selenodomain-associated transferase 2